MIARTAGTCDGCGRAFAAGAAIYFRAGRIERCSRCGWEERPRDPARAGRTAAERPDGGDYADRPASRGISPPAGTGLTGAGTIVCPHCARWVNLTPTRGAG